jgi:hypothetical protein
VSWLSALIVGFSNFLVIKGLGLIDWSYHFLCLLSWLVLSHTGSCLYFLLLYWGYIKAFTKVLTIYKIHHTWILLIHQGSYHWKPLPWGASLFPHWTPI